MKKVLGNLKGFVKKNKLGSAFIAILVIAMGYFGLHYFNTYRADVLVATNPDKAVAKAATVNDSTWNLRLDSTSSENEVIQDMHEMTHQKVEADTKWGAIPMIPDTINQVYKVVEASTWDERDDLLAMLERWKKGDFDNVAADHNYLWEWEDGNTGEATGNATPAEEAQFVLENFSSKVK